MAVPEKKIRGLQNIRTLSGRDSQALAPHKAYMRIACLEMEKARRGEEKSSALARVAKIDARFNDIDAEKEVLLDSLAQQDGGRHSDRSEISDFSGLSSTSEKQVKEAGEDQLEMGFDLRY